MTVITNARPTANGWAIRARRTLAKAASQGAAAASAARHRYRRPALVVGSFTSFDIAAWQVNAGVGWLVLGALFFTFEMITSEDG